MSQQARSSAKQSKQAALAGFSLIELLVVVSVILVIAAIAIPNFIRSKMRANEASAVENMRTISTAEVVYSTTYGIGFSPTLLALAGQPVIPDAAQAGLIDTVLATGSKSGYHYLFTVVHTDASGNVTDYSINADPITVGATGERHFYIDQSAIIRQSLSAAAGPNDPALQ